MKKMSIALSALLLVTHLGYGQKQNKEQQQPLPVRQKHFSDSIETNYQFEKVSFDQLNPNAKILRLATPKKFTSFEDFCNSFQTLHPLLQRIGKSYAASVLQNPDIKVYVYYETDTRLGAFRL